MHFRRMGIIIQSCPSPAKASQAASRQASKHPHKSSHLNHLVVVELDIDDAVLRYRLDCHALEVYG